MHTIRPASGAARKRKRVGRGNASGHGTYSSRGQKGQKARSGVSNLKRLGMKQVLLRTPKIRGFKSKKPKNQPVNFDAISAVFKDGDEITPKTLLKAGLIDSAEKPVKILAKGGLKLKNLKFKGVKMSENASQRLGGTDSD